MATSGPNYYTISCDELRLSIEFEMNYGEFGRIGSSPEMEISLPLVGLSERECSIHLDQAGILWLLRDNLAPPVRIEPPGYFQTGPYKFLVRENVEQRTPTGPSPTTKLSSTDFSTPRRIVASVLGLVALGATIWFISKYPNRIPQKTETPQAKSFQILEKAELPKSQHAEITAEKEFDKLPKPSEISEKAPPTESQVAEKIIQISPRTTSS